jgi:phosphate:Na+ symporter
MFIGLLLTLPFQRRQIQTGGGVLLGLGMIFAGLAGMETALAPLASQPAVGLLFEKMSHPVTGVLAGTLVTALLQSSSTSVGILQAFAATGTVSFSAAVAIICGQNIGTCSTACLAAANGGKNAKFVARFHLYFNILGAVLFLVLYHFIERLFPIYFQGLVPDPKGIAMIHTVFNVASTVVFLPFHRQLVALSQFSPLAAFRQGFHRTNNHPPV